MEFEQKDMYEIRAETNNLSYFKNRMIKGLDKGDYRIYDDRLKLKYTPVEPVKEALIKAYEDLRDVTGTKGTDKLRKIIIALGGFK